MACRMADMASPGDQCPCSLPARRFTLDHVDREKGVAVTMAITPVRGGSSHRVAGMREHKAAATTAGILYIIGTVAGILSKVVAYFPVHDADDPFAYAAKHSGAVATGALLVLVMGLSLAFVPVVLFPILRRVDEVLATGYLIIRGAVETAAYVILAIAWLLLVPLAETMSAGPGTASPAGVRLGTLVIDSDGASAMLTLVFCLGAVLFYVLLYRSRIVPLWITLWGFVGIPLYAAAYLLAMYGAIGSNSSEQNLRPDRSSGRDQLRIPQLVAPRSTFGTMRAFGRPARQRPLWPSPGSLRPRWSAEGPTTRWTKPLAGHLTLGVPWT